MKDWDLGKKIMLGGIILSIISLFFTWANVLFLSANGFQVDAYLFLVVFIYPAIQLIRNKHVNTVGGYVCGGLGILFTILYIAGSNGSIFGASVNLAGTGAYVFIIACIVFLVGVYKQEEPIKDEK